MFKNYILTLFFSLSLYFGEAQNTISISTNNFEKDVYFKLSDKTQQTFDVSSWDIAFSTGTLRDVSIIVNENKGWQLYLAKEDTIGFWTLDTPTLSKKPIFNTTHSWVIGAFNNLGNGGFDFGWGTYNPNAGHITAGTKQFILINKQIGLYYKMRINEFNTNSDYIFEYAHLDNSNYHKTTLNKTDYSSRHFAHFSLAENKVVDGPTKDSWDLIFTKYTELIQAGPEKLPYLVSGILSAPGVEVAQRNGVDTSNNDYSGLSFSDTINIIGYDWKTFNRNTSQYEYTPNLTYFVKTADETIYKIYFTEYADGTFKFNLRSMTSSILNFDRNESISVYPNPSNDGKIYVDASVLANQFSYQVIGINGEILFSSNNVENNFDYLVININNYKKGTYFLKIVDNSGKNYSAKVVVQ